MKRKYEDLSFGLFNREITNYILHDPQSLTKSQQISKPIITTNNVFMEMDVSTMWPHTWYIRHVSMFPLLVVDRIMPICNYYITHNLWLSGPQWQHLLMWGWSSMTTTMGVNEYAEKHYLIHGFLFFWSGISNQNQRTQISLLKPKNVNKQLTYKYIWTNHLSDK